MIIEITSIKTFNILVTGNTGMLFNGLPGTMANLKDLALIVTSQPRGIITVKFTEVPKDGIGSFVNSFVSVLSAYTPINNISVLDTRVMLES